MDTLNKIQAIRMGTYAFTATGRIFVPERKINKPSRTFTYLPLRGYAFHQAVMSRKGICIGWISVDTISLK